MNTRHNVSKTAELVNRFNDRFCPGECASFILSEFAPNFRVMFRRADGSFSLNWFRDNDDFEDWLDYKLQGRM